MMAQFISLLCWWLGLFILGLLVVKRVGLSLYWRLVQLVPMLRSVIVLWVVAFKRWPQSASEKERLA